jgi:hypothetical protein
VDKNETMAGSMLPAGGMNVYAALRFLAAAVLLAPALHADVFLVPDATADLIVRVNSAGAKSNLVTSGLTTPEQAVVDASGNLYGAGKVLESPLVGGGPIQIGDAVSGVTALAFEPGGNLFVADNAGNRIFEVMAAGGS